MNRIKQSIITAGIENYEINRDLNETYVPKPGDVALVEVLEIGKHKTVQAVSGNNLYLFPGDKVLVTFGSRYASNQFEGYVPNSFKDTYQILGGGGVVGQLESMHYKYEIIGPTQVKLLGYAVNDDNEVINTHYYNIEKKLFSEVKPKDYSIYLSVGASMDSGKTTTAAYLSRGLMLSGKKVAYVKLTGTVYAKDRNYVRNAGAHISLDFSICGYPSTYLESTECVLNIFATLTSKIEQELPDIDVLIIEIADGLVQKETYALLNHEQFMENVDGVVLSCPDSLSASGGIDILRKFNIEPIIVSGLFTASPLMVKEVEQFTDLPVFTLPDFIEDNGEKLVALLDKSSS